jgi:two-component system OmpR family sensor kinase
VTTLPIPPPLVAAPVVLGLVAAAVVRVQSPTKNVYAETRLWIALAVVGLVVATVVAAPRLAREQVQRAREESASAAVETAAAEHRRFLLRLDHELKNPVTAIQAGLANLASELAATPTSVSVSADAMPGGAELAPAPGIGAAAPAGALHSVSTQVRRLADLVAELRKLAELETRPIERVPVDLADMLTEVHEAVGELPGAAERVVTLTIPQAPWPLGTIPGDRDLLFLAIHNLVVNAVKFTGPGDRIEMRARDEGDQVVVEVADTGIGIPGDEVDQVWDELARGSAAAGTPGSGLGLALARVIVGRHEGTVWVRSRVGDGTVVGFRLPSA